MANDSSDVNLWRSSQRGFRTFSLALHHPASWQWAKDRAASLVTELEAELLPDVVAAVQARDLESTVAELLAELGKQ